MAMEYAFKPDKILTLDSFIEIVEAVDEKVRRLSANAGFASLAGRSDKKEPEKIDKLRKIQGALYEILTKAHKFEMDKKPGQLFPYETLINIVVLANQQPRLTYTTDMRNLIV